MADFGRAGEGDFIDIHVAGNGGAGRRPVAGQQFTTPAGKPASSINSPTRNAVSGVCSAGFITTVLPVASAGPSFQACIESGKFQGMIWPTTPTGSWRV